MNEDTESTTAVRSEEMTTAVSSNDGKKGAKDYSLFAQIFAATWISGWSAFKFAKIIVGNQFAELDITEIILSAFAIAACFLPVYFSIIMDKIKNIRFGGSK